MTSRTTGVDLSIQFLLAILLVTVQAEPTENGPQNFQKNEPQYAQNYKEVVMYLTPTQIRDYEAGHGLPNFEQTAPFALDQQTSDHHIPINEQEGQIVQNTLDILEANKMRFHHKQHNNADLEYSKSHEQHIDVRPIEEPNTEPPLSHPRVSITPKEPEHEQNKLKEHANKEQAQIANSHSYVQLFSHQNQDNPKPIELFHQEHHNVNFNEEINLQEEKNVEIQQDSHQSQKFKLIPYEYVGGQNQETHQRIQGQIFKQENEENKAQHQKLFIPAPPQLQNNNKEQQNLLNAPLQYAPQFSSNTRNEYLEKILQEIRLEREAAKIRAENIARSPAVVIRKDISIIRRRPVEVTRHVNIPYPAPYLVPIPSPLEVKIPQPYPVPLEIVRHIPVPVIKTETVEIEKPVPYQVEKHVAEIVEKKVYIPVEKPYTVERFVPVEITKKVPVEIPVIHSRPQKFTIIRHVWKH